MWFAERNFWEFPRFCFVFCAVWIRRKLWGKSGNGEGKMLKNFEGVAKENMKSEIEKKLQNGVFYKKKHR